ncbi:MAG TPA: hypothetical protein VFD05_03185 [Bacilli bacterium]|nr:hypothetical protein [Bacilli bacterium]
MNINLEHHLKTFLEQENKLFYSEAGFQHNFAVYLKKYGYDVLFEIPIKVYDYNDQQVTQKVDLIILKNNQVTFIELKYKTKQQVVGLFNNKHYELKDQGAISDNSAAFIKDISRLERIRDQFGQLPEFVKNGEQYNFNGAYAIFLTNSFSYVRDKTRKGKQNGEGVGYDDVRLTRKISKKGKLCVNKKEYAIVNNSYDLVWRKISNKKIHDVEFEYDGLIENRDEDLLYYLIVDLNKKY